MVKNAFYSAKRRALRRAKKNGIPTEHGITPQDIENEAIAIARVDDGGIGPPLPRLGDSPLRSAAAASANRGFVGQSASHAMIIVPRLGHGMHGGDASGSSAVT